MKKLLLVAFVLCFGFIKTQAQTRSISVPMGFATGQCEISRSTNILSVSSDLAIDTAAAGAEHFILVYSYVDLYITDSGGDPDEDDFNSIGTLNATTKVDANDVSTGSFRFITGSHSYNVQYEYYAQYYSLDDHTYYEEYGECSQDI